MDKTDLNRRFDYHKPDEARVIKHEHIRHTMSVAAHTVDNTVPDGREKSLAITALEEAMFWANAAIAREGQYEQAD